MQLGHATPEVHEPEERYTEVLVDELGEGDTWRCGQCGALVVDRQAHDGFHDRLDW